MTIKTTEQYWDCECAENFIHAAAVNHCPRCDTYRDEQPDSRGNEVLAAGLPIIAENWDAIIESVEAAVVKRADLDGINAQATPAGLVVGPSIDGLVGCE